jgi:hypothetical protein
MGTVCAAARAAAIRVSANPGQRDRAAVRTSTSLVA